MGTLRKVAVVLALGPLSLSIAATAATITYSNEATFLSETGSALLTLPNTSGTVASGDSILTIIDELTLAKDADGGFFAGDPIKPYWSGDKNFTVKSGIESFDLIPLKSIYAIGFSLYEPTSKEKLDGCNKPLLRCANSEFRIELFSGATSLGSHTIEPPDDAFSFYGFWTAAPITKATIRETVITLSGNLYSDDNEFFGRFMTGTTSNVAEPPPVPLPAAAWLLMSGLGGLGVLGRRRKAA